MCIYIYIVPPPKPTRQKNVTVFTVLLGDSRTLFRYPIVEHLTVPASAHLTVTVSAEKI